MLPNLSELSLRCVPCGTLHTRPPSLRSRGASGVGGACGGRGASSTGGYLWNATLVWKDEDVCTICEESLSKDSEASKWPFPNERYIAVACTELHVFHKGCLRQMLTVARGPNTPPRTTCPDCSAPLSLSLRGELTRPPPLSIVDPETGQSRPSAFELEYMNARYGPEAWGSAGPDERYGMIMNVRESISRGEAMRPSDELEPSEIELEYIHYWYGPGAWDSAGPAERYRMYHSVPMAPAESDSTDDEEAVPGTSERADHDRLAAQQYMMDTLDSLTTVGPQGVSLEPDALAIVRDFRGTLNMLIEMNPLYPHGEMLTDMAAEAEAFLRDANLRNNPNLRARLGGTWAEIMLQVRRWFEDGSGGSDGIEEEEEETEEDM